MKAVILAAGVGMRIRGHHRLPKGFIEIHEKAIIVESLDILKQQGIEDILLVVGYVAQHYEQLAKREGLSTVYNKNYECSGSLYSLYCARDWIDDDFLLLESDLIYEAKAVQEICNSPHPNAILVSGPTQSHDEIYVEARNQHLVNMSKNADELKQDKVLGEFVGINKLSLSAYQQLIAMLDHDAELLHAGHYEENGLVSLAKKQPVFCLKSDLQWCEIDNFDHLQKAKQLYPKIRERKNVYTY